MAFVPLTFEQALTELKAGKAIRRSGWADRFIALSPGTEHVPYSNIWSPAARAFVEKREDYKSIKVTSSIVQVFHPLEENVICGDGIVGTHINMGWNASPQDLLANDWVVCEV